MELEITIKNYRCFPDTDPAQFVIREGEPVAFVGVNNAGKSSLIRFFYEFRNYIAQSISLLGIPELPERNAYGGQALRIPSVADALEVFHNGNNRDLQFTITMRKHGNPPQSIEVTVDRQTRYWRVASIIGVDRVTEGVHYHVRAHRVHRVTDDHIVTDFSDLASACSSLGQGLYAGPFRNALGATQGPYYDLDIGSQFISQWRNRMVSPSVSERSTVRGMERLLADLFGFASLDIDVDHDNTFLLEIDGHSYRLPEVGAGFAQIFVVLVNAIVKKPHYILIDEPELNLHPALQLRFLTELATYAEKGVLFATHNLGLARSVTSQIYSVRKREKSHSEVRAFEATDDLPEMLGELSYGAYHDLGYDTLLLVEGPTELRTLQQLLRKLGKDQQVVLMPMGGRGMINRNRVPELTEIKRVVSGVQVLIDSERKTEIKRVVSGVQVLIDSERKIEGETLEHPRLGFVEACNTVKIPCKVLDWRAMENYFPDRAVKAAKGQSAHALGPFDDRAGSAWGKNENWLVATEMTREEVLNAGDLGAFLATL